MSLLFVPGLLVKDKDDGMCDIKRVFKAGNVEGGKLENRLDDLCMALSGERTCHTSW